MIAQSRFDTWVFICSHHLWVVKKGCEEEREVQIQQRGRSSLIRNVIVSNMPTQIKPVAPIAPVVQESCKITRYKNEISKTEYLVGESFHYTFRWSEGIVQLGSQLNERAVSWQTPMAHWNNDKAGTAQPIYDAFIPAGQRSQQIHVRMFGRTASGQIISCEEEGTRFLAVRAIASQPQSVESTSYTCNIRRNANGSAACIYFTTHAFYTVGVYDCSNGATIVVHKFSRDDGGRLNCYNGYQMNQAPQNQSIIKYLQNGPLKPF